MSNAENTTAPAIWIEWDMGNYGPFDTYSEAYAYQRANRMTGSAIVEN